MIGVDVFDKRWPVWDMIREIKDRINDIEIQLPEWNYRKAEYINPRKYKYLDIGTISQGDRWDEDYTYFFQKEFIVPEELEGRNIYLYMDIGGESQVYINNNPIGSIDIVHSDVHITEKGKSGDGYLINVQAAYNAQEYVRSIRMYGRPYPSHVFKEAKIISKNRIIQELYYTASLLFDICVLEENEGIRDCIFKILRDTLYSIDYHGERDKFIQDASKAREILIESVKELNIPKKYGKMIFTGHSHLDLTFKWTIKETIRKIERTLTNTSKVIERYPEGIFTHSQVQILGYLSYYYPELFSKFHDMVSIGNIELIGNAWTEFDSNIPSAESIIRHFLYGRDFYKQYFNKESKVCFLPDTFGFSAVLPQILIKSGFQFFVTSKLNWNDTNRFPYNYFIWEGIDGSRIKAYIMPKGYGGDISFSAVLENYNNSVEKISAKLFLYGAGDGGGGINEDMMCYKRALKELDSFVEVEDNTIENCLIEIDKMCPNPNVYHGELYLERHRGTYTSQGKIKKYNRQCEQLLRKVEFFSVIAEKEGVKYPKEEILEGWKLILLNQFHDIIAGSCIREAVEEAWKIYGRVMTIGLDIIKKVEKGLIKKENNNYIVVWNTLSWNRTDIVKIHIPNKHIDILDNDKEINYQIIGEDEKGLEVIAAVEDIPSFGYKKLILKKRDSEIGSNNCHPDTNVLENYKYKIVFNEFGEIVSLIDKENNREVLSGKGNILEAFTDRPGYFDSWDISADFEKRKILVNDLKEMQLIEKGPVRWTMKVVKRFKKSTIIQYISIYRDIRRIDFRTEIDFYEPQVLLKAGFEVNVNSDKAVFDLSMGSIIRSTLANNSKEKAQYEVPAHKWADLSQKDYGVSILNDCKYGYDIKGNKMRITLLKTGIYPDDKQDIGHHSFTYSLLPHKGDWREGDVVKAGYELNSELITMRGDIILDKHSYIDVNTNSIVVEQIKKAEKDDGIIIRLYESQGIEDEITIKFNIKIKDAYICDMMENELKRINIQNDTLHLKLKPYEIYTLKMKYKFNN